MFATHSTRDLSGKGTVSNTVSSSHATMMRRVEGVSSNLHNELRNKAKELEILC